MKKMERIDHPLFSPLTVGQERRIATGVTTQTPVTALETANPNPDFSRDGDHE